MLGIVLMIAGIFLISIKDAGSKFLVSGYHPFQIMALSAWLTIVMLLFWTIISNKNPEGIRKFKTKYWKQHFVRSVIGVFAGVFFLYSLKYLKFVEVTVIICRVLRDLRMLHHQVLYMLHHQDLFKHPRQDLYKHPRRDLCKHKRIDQSNAAHEYRCEEHGVDRII